MAIMKKLIIGLFIAISALAWSSCTDDIYAGYADQYVITYGTPYYEGGVIRYYIYGGHRYYPSYRYAVPYRHHYHHNTPHYPARPRVTHRRPNTSPHGVAPRGNGHGRRR